MNSARPHFRSMCWLLACTTVLHPLQAVSAQQPGRHPPDRKYDLTYAPKQAFAFVNARPHEVLTSPALEFLPTEVISAITIQEFGIDPAQIEDAQAFLAPPSAFGVGYGLVLRFGEPFRIETLNDRLVDGTVEDELDNGKEYLRSPDPQMPSIYMPDARTLVLATDGMLHQMVAADGKADSPLIQALRGKTTRDSLNAVINLQMVRPLINAGLAQIRDVPPAYAALLDAPNHIDHLTLAVSVGDLTRLKLAAHATNPAAADRLDAILDESMQLLQDQFAASIDELEASEDAVEQAMARYLTRMSDKMVVAIRPDRRGEQFVIAEADAEQQSLVNMYAMSGILVALLLPAVQAARAAARRASSTNNMKRLMLALHNYAAAHNRFPAHANYDDQKRPLLSWRVHVLPYMEEGHELYQQFHLDEPWDSPHNRKLIPLMPDAFRSDQSEEEYKTNYLALVGKGMFMEGESGFGFNKFRDGTSKTMALVEVDDARAVVWTKPDDFQPDPEQPANGLGGLRPGDLFIAAFCDGHVRTIPRNTPADTLRAMFTRAGGEPVRLP